MRLAKTSLSVAAVLVAAACGPPPHAIVNVEDPFSLATTADRIEVDGRVITMDGATFPLRLTLTADEESDARLVEVIARRGNEARARGFAFAQFLRNAPATTTVELGAACSSAAEGTRCQLPRNAGDGVCSRGRCGTSFCPDGFVDPDLGEECDDGNASNEDACTNECRAARCGDGFTRLGVEDCDDGNEIDEDDCPSTCEDARCGDGFTHSGVEACDDGNVADSDDCLNSCELNVCGDSVLNVVAGDDCDDGNTTSGDGCSATCRLVVWETDIGAPAGEAAIIHDDDYVGLNQVSEVRLGKIPRAPREIIVTTESALIALDAANGLELWRYDAGSPITGQVGHNGVRYAFSTEDEVVHFVRAGIGITATVPASLEAPVIVGALQQDFTDVEYAGFAFSSDGVARSLTAPGTLACPGSEVCVNVVGDLASDGIALGASCPTGQCLMSLQHPFTISLGRLGEVLEYRFSCGGTPLAEVRHTLEDPDDFIVSNLAFLGNGNNVQDSGDLRIGISAFGGVYRFPVSSGDGSVCGPSTTSPVVRLGGSVADAEAELVGDPIIAPVAGFTVIIADAGGALHKRASDNLDDEFAIFWEDRSVRLSHTPALDAEGFLHFGDSSGRLHKIHMVSAQRAFVHALPSPVKSSPLIGGNLVYVQLEDGRVMALERGGSRVPVFGAWHRQGGASNGIAMASCRTTRGEPLWVAALLLLLWRRRRG